MSWNLPPGVTQNMIDAHYEPSDADLASMLPMEPDRGAAVRDRHGYVSQRDGDLWRCAADGRARTWADLQSLGPLHLLVDGPVIL